MKIGLARLRLIIQAVTFAVSNLGFASWLKTGFCYPFLYCYGCPLASAACPIGTLQHFTTRMREDFLLATIPLYLLGAIGLFGTAFGRAFCGWACPFGSFQDLLRVRRNTGKKLRRFKYSKFAMLFVLIVVAWVTLDTVFCKFCPAGSLFAAIPASLAFPSLRLGVFFYVHLLTLTLTILLVLLVSRFWCRYLCPFGSIGVMNGISLLTLSIDKEKCEECQNCLEVCPMGIDELKDIASSDCILCGKCVEACQTDALKFGVRK